jgi:hypothetical protein
MARPNFEDVARQIQTEIEAIPYDHHDGEATALAVVARALGAMYDRGLEDAPDGPVDMPVCTRPHALEVPLPEGATYRPMTTAAESVRQLAERIETRAKNDLLMAQKLREIL